MEFHPNEEVVENKKLPHLLKYMGSKREIIDFISESIKNLNTTSQEFCDLFAGTGVVSAALKDSFNVQSNDIQHYSKILSSTYLLNLNTKISINTVKEIESHVTRIRESLYSKYTHQYYDYSSPMSFEEFKSLELRQQKLIEESFQNNYHLFVKYYSGTYWTFEQCTWIDSIRATADIYNGSPLYYLILSALIYAMSYTSQSTGHYAQYRDASSDSSMQDILSYRIREVWPYFEKKITELIEYVNNEIGTSFLHKSTILDYKECLKNIANNTIVYADPPYQSVHYSRFYHAIETLVRYDYPQVFHKGRYRDDRHQSPFCLKTTVNKAFNDLFKLTRERDSHLVLSYSDTGMIPLLKIKEIGNEYFTSNYEFICLEKQHIHRTMGRSDTSTQGVTEYLLIYRKR